MKNIRYFESREEFEQFLKKECVRFLNDGSEGVTYQTRDNHAIKVIVYTDDCINHISNFNYILEYEKIITADLVPSPYFLFPVELYVVDSKLCGYKTKLVKKDYFKNLIEPIQYLSLDLRRLENAFIRFQLEMERLSSLGVFIYDLPTNIMYDGSHIYAIDRCCDTFEKDAKLKNHKTFELAVEAVFEPLLLGIFDSDDTKEIEINNIGDYLAQIKSYCIEYVRENPDDDFEGKEEFNPKIYLKRIPIDIP